VSHTAGTPTRDGSRRLRTFCTWRGRWGVRLKLDPQPLNGVSIVRGVPGWMGLKIREKRVGESSARTGKESTPVRRRDRT
jgi:hypothetical protein